jgi:hypothetical protein
MPTRSQISTVAHCTSKYLPVTLYLPIELSGRRLGLRMQHLVTLRATVCEADHRLGVKDAHDGLTGSQGNDCRCMSGFKPPDGRMGLIWEAHMDSESHPERRISLGSLVIPNAGEGHQESKQIIAAERRPIGRQR